MGRYKNSNPIHPDPYTAFLYGMIDNAKEYDVLLGVLHGIPFYSLVPNDGNRGEDGRQLRQTFIDNMGDRNLLLNYHLIDSNLGDCTVLEMLLALSDRLVFETIDSEWEKTRSEWFFILLENLSIEIYDNSYVRPDQIRMRIEGKVNTFLDRKYDSHGVGGLFPLKNPRQDQRKVEIWYQMSAYIMENYF